ncbi:hypothetical protein DFH28DRAFT_1129068 [Melampsora americana]|nr:hypothetical protein DFH28DRAFT_1129068 [Melampsora americana]
MAPNPSTPPRPPGSQQNKRMQLEEAKVKAEEMKGAREDHLKRNAEAKASLTQINELKVLMMSKDLCQTDVAKDVPIMMHQRLKEKYEGPDASGAASGASTSNT